MRSSLQFRIDPVSRKPIIKVSVFKSFDDVRDEIANDFIYALNYESNFCTIESNGAHTENGNNFSDWVITPVGKDGLYALRDRINEVIKQMELANVGYAINPETMKSSLTNNLLDK